VKELIVKLIYGMILPFLTTTTAGSNNDELLHSYLLGGLPRLQGLYFAHYNNNNGSNACIVFL